MLISSIAHNTLTLFLLIDAFGAIATVSTLLKAHSSKAKMWIIARESFFALCVLSVFASGGVSVLAYLGLSEAAMRISSFFVIGLVGIGMIYPHYSPFKVPTNDDQDVPNGKVPADHYFSPIAMPLLVGASTITSTSLLSASSGVLAAFIAVILALLFSCIIIQIGCIIIHNDKLLLILERLAGMILVMMAIQSLLDGIKLYIGGL